MNAICTTSIHSPSKALRKFAEMPDWKLVVAGDMKTPHQEYRELNCIYLSPEDQQKTDPILSDSIGWNCIQRRNFAFLYACKEMKADIIATVDDDNIPMDDWGKDLMIGKEQKGSYSTIYQALDPVGITGQKALWHRGFPLELVAHREQLWSEEVFTPSIQADFWNGDPDVDAVCRMVANPLNVTFENAMFPIASSSPAPFNSQNTFLFKEVMPHYFMHGGVGRWDDIVASYYVQSLGYRAIYGKPSVVQRRNAHDVMADFKAERWGYENTLSLVTELAKDPNNLFKFLTPMAERAFRRYQTHFE